jgi:hypothetical protein
MKVIDKIASFLETKVDRRGFLVKLALIGSALSIGPIDFALHPQSAWAFVCQCASSACSCGDLCCDGYTEFCCTLFGQNVCPENSVVAGWWRAEGPGSFCDGPRYYLDCNALCNGCGCNSSGICLGTCSNTDCQCAFGNCSNRHTGCTLFRYGQCNQDIECVGPILCRVVTCMAPWQIDATCTQTLAEDDFTYFQDAACLHEPMGAITAVNILDNVIKVTGWALDPDTPGPVSVSCFLDGLLIGTVPADQLYFDNVYLHENRGYSFEFTAGYGRSTLCVKANPVYPSAAPVSLGCQDLIIGEPFGHLDAVVIGPDEIKITGWAIDPAGVTARVQLTKGSEIIDIATADLYRPDVAQVYPQFGPYHGFNAVVEGGAGDYEICAAILSDYGLSPVSLGCKELNIRNIPFGNIDRFSFGTQEIFIEGWAIDPKSSESVYIEVVGKDRVLATMKADIPRYDVFADYPSYGLDHGFNAAIKVPPGIYEICIVALSVHSKLFGILECRLVDTN